jgi:hypothetical protein
MVPYFHWSRLFFLAFVWLCFIARGLFYCSFLPVWEGYDEWAHFAVIERMATDNRLLADRNEPVSFDVDTSMRLAPAPWNTGKSFTTEDEYWRLPSAERAERMRELNTLPLSWSRQPDPAGPPMYEALQPPLYYWISSLPYRLLATRPILERVFLLRYFGVLVCSLAIPVVFLVAQSVSGSARTALFVITLLAVLPELMIDVGRVGNECLGVLLFSWLTLRALPDNKQDPSFRSAIWTGVALGLGLLTKAYFLTAIPALGLLYIWRMWRSKRFLKCIAEAACVFGVALLIAGWWYVRNRITTGSWSGLLETVKLVNYTLPQFAAGALRVQWRNALDSILLSHVWFGAWSSLGVRSWMYHLLFLIAAMGAVGVVVALFQRGERKKFIVPLAAIYGFFWLGQLYNVLLLYLTKGASTSMGWYMYCVIAAEATLLVIGLQTLAPARWRAWVLATLVLLVGALDVYTVDFVSIPYYVGLIAHRPHSDALQALHLIQLRGFGMSEILDRLTTFKPFWLKPDTLGFAWAVYFVATLSLICSAWWLAWQGRGAEYLNPLDSGPPDYWNSHPGEALPTAHPQPD